MPNPDLCPGGGWLVVHEGGYDELAAVWTASAPG